MRLALVVLAAVATAPVFANETSAIFGSRSWQFRTPAQTAVALDFERERQKVSNKHYEKYTGIHGGTWHLSSTNIANMSVVTVDQNGNGYVSVKSKQGIGSNNQKAEAEQQFVYVDNEESETPLTVNMLNGKLGGGY